MKTLIASYLSNQEDLKESTDILVNEGIKYTEGLKANQYYFDQPEWAEEYLKYCHRSEFFRRRWEKALGELTDKIVVDIGCGPGNIFATVNPKPKLLIGVDIAPYSLKLAKKAGYIPVLADAQNLPFVSGFADVVTINATLHHCDDMEKVLTEGARLVKPGGLLITDHDPQISAWNYKGIAKQLWDFREVYYRVVRKGFHKSREQQYWGLKSEIHHKPGHGVSDNFFMEVLEKQGFKVNVYPHNHNVGEEVFNGETGKAEFKYRLGCLLSGNNPLSKKSALSLMCVAEKQK